MSHKKKRETPPISSRAFISPAQKTRRHDRDTAHSRAFADSSSRVRNFIYIYIYTRHASSAEKGTESRWSRDAQVTGTELYIFCMVTGEERSEWERDSLYVVHHLLDCLIFKQPRTGFFICFQRYKLISGITFDLHCIVYVSLLSYCAGIKIIAVKSTCVPFRERACRAYSQGGVCLYLAVAWPRTVYSCWQIRPWVCV